jgi:hypothetical protein
VGFELQGAEPKARARSLNAHSLRPHSPQASVAERVTAATSENQHRISSPDDASPYWISLAAADTPPLEAERADLTQLASLTAAPAVMR